MLKNNRFAQQQHQSQQQNLTSLQERSPPTSYNSHQYTASQLPAGGGRCQYDDGGWYAGQWEIGMAHGHGVCGSSPNAKEVTEFSGLWQQGFEVNGVSRWANGNTYEGQWLQGKKHGLGMERRGHWVYKGEWTHGNKGRYGVSQSSASNLRYEGTWTSGIKDGYGVETYPDEGTYHGQWMRGMRHGYGVRQSAPYIIALRSPHKTYPNCFSTPSSEIADDHFISFDRDSRMEEHKGGFVLQTRTAPPENIQTKPSKRPGLFDRLGRQSLRKSLANELKIIRQKSSGDLNNQGPNVGGRSQSAGPNSRASSTGGSVRSTTSAFSQISSTFSNMTTSTTRSSDDLDDELGSFCSDVDLANERVTERYAGEWKNDKRSGFGVCERSDGVKYEGDWLNNRKHGYGVTTLANGTRIEGKYKNNILVSSGKGSKLFALRSTKIRDKVEASVSASQKAANMAVQKLETANVRMTSARVRADQADEAAKRALNDAELADSVARQYTAESQGTQVIANRQHRDDESLGSYVSPKGKSSRLPFSGQKFDSTQQPQGFPTEQTSKPTRKFAFFRLKKSDQSKRPKSETRNPLSTGFSLFGNSSLRSSSSNKAQTKQPSTLHSYNQGYESVSNTTLSKPNPPTDFGKDHDKLFQPPSSKYTHTVPKIEAPLNVPHANNLNIWPGESLNKNKSFQNNHNLLHSSRAAEIEGSSTLLSRDSIYNAASRTHFNNSDTAPSSHLRGNDDRGRIDGNYGNSEVSIYGPQNQGINSYNLTKDNHTFYNNENFVRQGSYTVESVEASTVMQAWPVTQTLSPNYDQPYRSRNFPHVVWNHDSHGVEETFTPHDQSPLLSSEDAHGFYNDLMEPPRNVQSSTEPQRDRRKSLPSIIKEPPPNSPLSLNFPTSSTSRAPQVASSYPKKTLLGQTSLSLFSSKAASQTNPADSVPTDTYVIENGIRKRVKPVTTTKVTSALSKVPHYEMEAPNPTYKRGDRGSLPDVSTVCDSEVLPREVVYQMSQRRREELMRQREELERRYGGNIVLRLEDILDWFRKKKLVILLMLFNVALIYIFISLLKNPIK